MFSLIPVSDVGGVLDEGKTGGKAENSGTPKSDMVRGWDDFKNTHRVVQTWANACALDELCELLCAREKCAHAYIFMEAMSRSSHHLHLPSPAPHHHRLAFFALEFTTSASYRMGPGFATSLRLVEHELLRRTLRSIRYLWVFRRFQHRAQESVVDGELCSVLFFPSQLDPRCLEYRLCLLSQAWNGELSSLRSASAGKSFTVEKALAVKTKSLAISDHVDELVYSQSVGQPGPAQTLAISHSGLSTWNESTDMNFTRPHHTFGTHRTSDSTSNSSLSTFSSRAFARRLSSGLVGGLSLFWHPRLM